MKVLERQMDDCFDGKERFLQYTTIYKNFNVLFFNFNILFVLCSCCNKQYKFYIGSFTYATVQDEVQKDLLPSPLQFKYKFIDINKSL